MRRAVSSIAALLWVLAGASHAEAPEQLEYRVKAAILYNIAKFVEWPAGKSPNLQFCVLGQDPFGPILDEAVAGKRIGDRVIVIHRYQRAADSPACNLLFIGASESKRIKAIITTLDNSGALTVSDIPRFAEQGGMINFILQDGAVRFEVNVAATEQAGLQISSQLLRLARIVGRREGKQ